MYIASAMTGFVLYTIPSIVLAVMSSQYTDDSDYNDFGVYEDMPIVSKSTDNIYDILSRDDFYILSEELKNLAKPVDVVEQRLNEYRVSDMVYRYTKQRIPGYDYDELDSIDDKNMQRCDERSVWTHCLCQFTCFELNQVDCYTPCKSGCACKENYVFDEETQQCVYPEHCHFDYNNHYT